MGVSKRLTQVLSSSPKIYFDDYSRFIIMSDCHRGDGDGQIISTITKIFLLQHYNTIMKGDLLI